MMYRSPSVPSFNEGFDEKTWEIHWGKHGHNMGKNIVEIPEATLNKNTQVLKCSNCFLFVLTRNGHIQYMIVGSEDIAEV